MNRTGFVCHEHYFWHNTGASAGPLPYGLINQMDGHPESPQTKRRLLGLLEVAGALDQLVRIKPRRATLEEIARYHTREYIEKVQTLSAGVGGDAGELTPIGTGSFEIAQLSAGGCLEGLDALLKGQVDNVYCLNRPPGHHAEKDLGRGFCVFANNVLAVQRAQAHHKLGRIAIVDWDVHHGNSQEHAFIEDPSVLTVSVHQDNYYPANSGLLAENGRGRGAGCNINVPLPPGSGHGAYLDAWQRVVMPAVRRFRPELVIVSSGFDGSAMDPLGRMLATSETFRALARQTLDVAAEVCGGRVLALHEGGYSTAYVPFCGLAVFEELLGRRTEVADPFLPVFAGMGGQDLQPHQKALIDQAAALVARVPQGH
jgi:acetoin utilization deacetylase AcuC-like enzyme